jgi:hypothetical protein
MAPAVWLYTVFPNERDDEYPNVARPTFSARPPNAYRFAEPGDTIDHVILYYAAGGLVVAAAGLLRSWAAERNLGLWPAALALCGAAYWYAATPGPPMDGWHGLGWRTIGDPRAPTSLRLALVAAGIVVASVVLWTLHAARGQWRTYWEVARERRCITLLMFAFLMVLLRQMEIPEIVPAGYWPRWGLACGLLAFDLAMVRAFAPPPGRWARLGIGMGAILGWFALASGGLDIMWFQRPLHRLREVVPGRIYMSAMPTYRGLEVARERHHFKTIINLFPEDCSLRSPILPDELRFAREHGIQYIGGTSAVAESDPFLDRTLALAQDPSAWPILVHCHGCMDRTPAWVGIYRFLVEGRPLDQVMREIEQHRGYRPKASVTLLYNRVLRARAGDRYAADPTSQLLLRSAAGTIDPYYAELRAELERANPQPAARVSQGKPSSRRP